MCPQGAHRRPQPFPWKRLRLFQGGKRNFGGVSNLKKKVQITETVLRDANQSLMATRLPYSDYADILSTMDKAGYYSVE